MTVISQNTSVSYVGTGSAGPFPFNFSISTTAALKVIQNFAVLPSTAYTVAPVNNNYDNGGLVTLNTPLPVGQSLVLQRNTPLTQTSVFYDNLPNPMQQFEDGLDKLTEIVQEIVASSSGGGGGTGGGIYLVPINAGAPVFNGAGGKSQKLTLTQNAVATVAMWIPGLVMAFFIVQDGTGGRTLAWPASFKNAPTINPAPNGVTFFTVAQDDAGAIYCGTANWV